MYQYEFNDVINILGTDLKFLRNLLGKNLIKISLATPMFEDFEHIECEIFFVK